ncbi:MAG: beta-N-acetylglucosaminidase domain-containing protein [Planctomycetota bacterium]|jgi:hypothetical protein
MRAFALALLLLAPACRAAPERLPISKAVPPGTEHFALEVIPTPAEAELEDYLIPADHEMAIPMLGLGPDESFLLEVGYKSGRPVIMMADAEEAGRRFAISALRQLTVVRDGRTWVRAGSIRDRPGFPYRGSKRPLTWESAYRANFSHQNRTDHRPRFVAVLSPGGVLDATETGVAKAARFFAEEHAKGTRLFAIEFDDVGFGLTDETGERFGSYPAAIVHYLRECREALRRIDRGAVLYWLPQTYWTRDPRLETFARDIGLAGGLPEDLGLVLTGPEVISEEIPAEEIARARRAFGLTRRKALIYDNKGREGDHGPLRGRGADLLAEADAVFGERGEVLNRITRLDYAWNPRAYDPERSHLLACREVVGIAAAPYLHRLILEWPRLGPLARFGLYLEARRRLAPPPHAPVDAEAYLERVWRDLGKPANVDTRSQ